LASHPSRMPSTKLQMQIRGRERSLLVPASPRTIE
jgi:hypothetical protein